MKLKKSILFKLFRKATAVLVLISLLLSLTGCINIRLPIKNTKTEKGQIGYNSEINLRYQYSKLSKKEKEIYLLILSAISNGDRAVDIAYYNVSTETCKKIINAVFCDSPDIFWVSRDFHMLYEGDQTKSIYFKYFDGHTLDKYELKNTGSISYEAKADQNLIKNRIEDLNKRLATSLSMFSDNNPVETEYALHDWVAENVIYNQSAADAIINKSTEPEVLYFDDFNIYGALVNGSAVCEGYAKLFQLFCLLLDINCTQITGTYEGEGHMWNAVYLSDSWYYVDVTFDDVDTENITCIYTYLNIDFDTLLKTHTIDETLLSVPDCNSDRLNYCKNNLINVANNSISANYSQTIAKDISKGKKYIMIYFPLEEYSEALLERLLYSINPSIDECISQHGKEIDKILTLDKAYVLIFLKNNEV